MKKIVLIILWIWMKQMNAQTCQASFIYTLGSNGYVTFTNTSTGTTAHTTYLWNWGDNVYGSQSGIGPHTYSYYYNGTYPVSLTITDSTTGCSNTVTNSVSITSEPPCNIQASMTYSVGPNGNTVAYTNTSTGNGGFCITTFICQLAPNGGNNTGSTVFGGMGSGAGGTGFFYPYNGIYTNTLTVSGGGCSSTFMDTVVISGQLTCSLMAGFTDTLGNNGQADFYNTSTGVLSNMKSIWRFGDGTLPDTVNAASHSYAYNGTYHVTLFVKDSFNICKDSIGKNITITNAPNTCMSAPSFSLSPNSSQAHAWVAVPNYSSQVINAVWTWGDGTSSAGLYPSHTYTAAGNYNICVKVYLACGDSATYCQTDTLSKNSSSSQVIQINVIGQLEGIPQITSVTNQVTVYPNPSTGMVTVESTNAGKQTLQVYDVTGKLVLTQSIQGKAMIDVTAFNEGVYNILLNGNEGVVVKRLVVLH